MSSIRAIFAAADRRAPRYDAFARASVRRGTMRRDVQLIDVSTGGARLTNDLSLRVGDRFWITLPGLGPMEADVVWTRTDELGCRFARALYDGALRIVIGA